MITINDKYLISPSILESSNEGIYYGQFSLANLSEAEKDTLGKLVSKRFTQMVALNADKIGTDRGTQIEIFKRVLGKANGDYRVFIKNGKISGLLMFKKYQTGQEKTDKVARREKFVTDQTILDPSKGERKQLLELFNQEIDNREDINIVLSQVKKDNVQMARALSAVGWTRVDPTKEQIQYKLYKNVDKYDIWKKQK